MSDISIHIYIYITCQEVGCIYNISAWCKNDMKFRAQTNLDFQDLWTSSSQVLLVLGWVLVCSSWLSWQTSCWIKFTVGSVGRHWLATDWHKAHTLVDTQPIYLLSVGQVSVVYQSNIGRILVDMLATTQLLSTWLTHISANVSTNTWLVVYHSSLLIHPFCWLFVRWNSVNILNTRLSILYYGTSHRDLFPRLVSSFVLDLYHLS